MLTRYDATPMCLLFLATASSKHLEKECNVFMCTRVFSIVSASLLLSSSGIPHFLWLTAEVEDDGSGKHIKKKKKVTHYKENSLF